MTRPNVPFYRRMTLNVIDGTRSDATIIAAHVSARHFPIQDTANMVDFLKGLCSGGLWRTYLYRLCIVGHGNRDGQWFGADWLSERTLPNLRDKLVELRPHFCAGALVTLEGCRTGYARGLLQGLSNAFDGVEVRAGTAYQRPLIPGLEGGVTTCGPRSCIYTGRTVLDEFDDHVMD